ncbi:MAG TPA: type III-B CRISPR module RAMP protein Cmr4, partial [Candidatus Desulfofervidus auxilii]|nr:type III-B CRISPR module RAMP protein Cmr4 [Candidatus Desulfofervidus auxilii]
MFKKSGLLTFYAETSLHMGSGTSLSYVDLPIQREKHTEFPIMQASGIKGVIREFAERHWKDDKTKVEVIFGPKEGDKFASCIVFTDAKILLFP